MPSFTRLAEAGDQEAAVQLLLSAVLVAEAGAPAQCGKLEVRLLHENLFEAANMYTSIQFLATWAMRCR